MMFITKPDSYREVDPEDFEKFLETCWDYTSCMYAGARCYSWRHNGRRFAVVMLENGVERPYVDPSLLEPANPND